MYVLSSSLDFNNKVDEKASSLEENTLEDDDDVNDDCCGARRKQRCCHLFFFVRVCVCRSRSKTRLWRESFEISRSGGIFVLLLKEEVLL